MWMTSIFKFVSAVFLLLASFPASAQFRSQSSYSDLYDGETVAAIKKHVMELSAAHLEGRKAGSEGEKAAAAYVAEMFKAYGVDVISPSEGEIFGIRKEDGDTLTSRNVVGFVQGYDKNLRNQYVLVGARLDNLGTMTMTIDGRPVERIYYGANGNASGIAMLLELARMVQTNSILFRRSVLFVAFGASEETFAGSWYFLNRSFSDADNIDVMVNLDMLGTGNDGFYAYTASNADLDAVIRRLSGDLQPVLPEVVAEEVYPSDHRAFYDKEIPAVHFTTGRYPEHDTDKDTQSILDYEMMEKELEYIYNFTVAVANMSSAPSFRPDDTPSRKDTYDDVVAYNDCDQRPLFLNSADPRKFLQEWVYKYLKYPEKAVLEGAQGRVLVDFIIEKDGRVTNVRVAKGVSEELDAEALKVISASPKWKPGRVAGEKVRTSMTMPVEFRLEKKGNKSGIGIKK